MYGCVCGGGVWMCVWRGECMDVCVEGVYGCECVWRGGVYGCECMGGGVWM